MGMLLLIEADTEQKEQAWRCHEAFKEAPCQEVSVAKNLDILLKECHSFPAQQHQQEECSIASSAGYWTNLQLSYW